MSDTPQTDFALRQLILVGIKYGFDEGVLRSMADNSRDLERENAKLRAELEEYRSIAEQVGATKAISERDKALADLAAAQAENTKLKEELDQIKGVLSSPVAVWINILRGTIAKPGAIEELERNVVSLGDDLAAANERAERAEFDKKVLSDFFNANPNHLVNRLQAAESHSDALRRALEDAVTTLTSMAKVFRHYEQLHLAKGPEGGMKAMLNANHALSCETTLTAAKSALGQ